MGLPPAAPLCPDSASQRCNSVTVLDLGGRASETIDVYGIVTRHYFDLDGHEVRTVLRSFLRNWDAMPERIRQFKTYLPGWREDGGFDIEW
jgi:hypothetical protein